MTEFELVQIAEQASKQAVALLVDAGEHALEHAAEVAAEQTIEWALNNTDVIIR